MRRVIGIDPGIETTGYGIIDSNGHDHSAVTFGTISPPRGKPLYERLAYLYGELKEVIGENSPEEMAVEQAFFSKNARTALVLGQARGVILLVGAHQDIHCFEYAPRKIKMAVVGNGNASKEQVQYMVISMLSLQDTPSKLDVTDALATALCHLSRPQEM